MALVRLAEALAGWVMMQTLSRFVSAAINEPVGLLIVLTRLLDTGTKAA
jgi:hypothetical protein